MCAWGTGAFYGCKNLKQIDLPDTLMSIGDCAFSSCSSLRELIIPNSVIEVGECIVSGCTSLEKIYVPFNEGELPEGWNENWNYKCSAEIVYGNKYEMKYKVLSYEDVIDEELTDEELWQLEPTPEECFDFCNVYGALPTIGLKEAKKRLSLYEQIGVSSMFGSKTLVIPSKYKENDVLCCGGYRDSSAYYGFVGSDIEIVVVSEGIERVGVGGVSVFLGSSSLRKVLLPNTLKIIGWSAFKECKSLKDVVMPSKMERVDSNAFMGCSSLESIVIPDGVELLQGEVFSGCTSLENVELPQSVTQIWGQVFAGCSSLKAIELPVNLTVLGYGTFKNCSGLVEIRIPNSVKTMGADVFNGCSSLEKIYVPFKEGEQPNEWDENWNAGCPAKIVYEK